MTEFKEEFQIRGFHLKLAAPEHQELNRQAKVTWRMLCKVSNSLMVHAYSFLINVYDISYFSSSTNQRPDKKDGDPTTPFKLVTGKKSSVSHLRVLLCPCVIRKATAHIYKKALNMCHQAHKGFRGIFVGIPQHQKGYLFYVPSTRKIIYLYDVVFDVSFLVR